MLYPVPPKQNNFTKMLKEKPCHWLGDDDVGAELVDCTDTDKGSIYLQMLN